MKNKNGVAAVVSAYVPEYRLDHVMDHIDLYAQRTTELILFSVQPGPDGSIIFDPGIAKDRLTAAAKAKAAGVRCVCRCLALSLSLHADPGPEVHRARWEHTCAHVAFLAFAILRIFIYFLPSPPCDTLTLPNALPDALPNALPYALCSNPTYS